MSKVKRTLAEALLQPRFGKTNAKVEKARKRRKARKATMRGTWRRAT